MRIAHVTDFYLPRLGGIETHIAALAEHQRRIGHQVDVVAAGGIVESSDPNFWPSPREGTTFESFHADAINPACAAVLAGGYDVVHVHAGLVTPLAFSVAARASCAGIPTVATVHSVIGHLAPVYRALDLLSGWEAWPIEWTAVSEVAAMPMRRLLARRRSVEVLPNAIDAAFWQVDHVPHERDRVVIAAVMRLARRKRPIQLLRILRQVRAATDPEMMIEADIVGDGPDRGTLEAYLARHGMSGWVRLPGRETHAEIRERFRHADVFVAPAIRESFGIAALEARAAGLPVVAMERAGIREFIHDGRSGLLVRDDADMVRGLVRLVTDPDARRAIAAHNQATPISYGWSEAMQLTELAYRRAAVLQGTPVHLVDPARPTSALLAAAGIRSR